MESTTGVHEITGVRLPLQHYTGSHAVFMYSTASDGNVTLQLKEPDDLDRTSLAAVLARLQDDSSFSISYQDADMLSDGSIDVLLGTGPGSQQGGGESVTTAPFDLFDSSNGPDLTLSPQTFTNSTEAFINDNSNSLGVPADNEAVSSTDEKKPSSLNSEASKLTVKRPRPKAVSPNRQGPQQCQVCSKVFGNASALAKHKLTHSDERKYICNMCGKAFKRQDHLNGHMLTHRNKKPYECKAEGCGKSYCDARSLRRHTENHHSSGSSNGATTMSPAQGAASGDAASPHGSSCIQYAPPPTTSVTSTTTTTTTSLGNSGSSNSTGKSQLQQLLATEPVKGGGANDGLTKQLDLIHQIMEQTQRQSHSVTTKTNLKSNSKSNTKSSSSKVQKPLSSQNASIKPSSSSPQSKVTSTTSPGNNASSSGKDQKPVECNLCHRKFKNIPALNGHMRLHGGYFKKDTDNKKNEKKDPNGPPLQTASVSVRALIEEKIISKRNISSSSDDTSSPVRTSAPPLFPLTVHSPVTSGTTSEADSSKTSFAVPAPPQLSTVVEKSRRHSDAETFTVPRTPQQDADTLADLILNKKEKVTVKRTTSDPGQSTPQIIQFQSGEAFTLGVTYQPDDGYLSPSLHDEVFTQVQDTMLLQGVDTQQLASIQFQNIETDSLLQDHPEQQLQEISLDDYNLPDSVTDSPSYQSTQSVTHQDLRAVLDSPLPESLAEFSTFHTTGSLDIPSPSYQRSPAQFSNSPHPSMAAQSPLQSPLVRHDSPAYTYPTPPASHEGQSPCFGQNTILPMVSPKQEYIKDIDQNNQLLTTDFFSTTMSSSAAVEEALEEVLPGESIAADDLYSSLSNSPPPQSPLSIGLTPVPSPLSNIPSTTVPSPHTQTNFTSTNNIHCFPLQSQMMPNSDDPLLSSSPKDFPTKKKFEFNGIPLKLISGNAIIDSNFTGILLDANGELKLIQTGPNAFHTKNIVLATPHIITQLHNNHPSKEEDANKKMVPPVKQIIQTVVPTATKQIILTKPKDVKIETMKHEEVFLSPTTISSNSTKNPRKRPRSEPLQLPILHQSRLRATRSKPHGSSRFTPSPILNPSRPGNGLYWNMKSKPIDPENQETTWTDPVPETDSTPHINVGSHFQTLLPQCRPLDTRYVQQPTKEDLLWDPGINKSKEEVEMYFDFACCAALPGGGRNQEYAMHVLNLSDGNIHEAMLKLMQPTPSLPSKNPLHDYHYSETEKWSVLETDLFQQALSKYGKDFAMISQEIGSKSMKQCVEFYYVYKKMCKEDYKVAKQLRERWSSAEIEEKQFADSKLLGIADSGSPITEQRSFPCEFVDCSASFNSKAALNGHIRIHGGSVRSNCPNTTSIQERKLTLVTSSNQCHNSETIEDYPCKICGKIFTKIKSRSAHMKSHRIQDEGRRGFYSFDHAPINNSFGT
ncbi:zinc finger protein 541 isoform X2 [Onthophagus taurus]|uniref:zinc finger protein 541 isoform X2 n=1 Tax=Onthophagus taurus TaxID=166361 RepID=UPI000C207456|nr:transcriptional-regulating factor 1 isoform X2 [Onthophagus taurus]